MGLCASTRAADEEAERRGRLHRALAAALNHAELERARRAKGRPAAAGAEEEKEAEDEWLALVEGVRDNRAADAEPLGLPRRLRGGDELEEAIRALDGEAARELGETGPLPGRLLGALRRHALKGVAAAAAAGATLGLAPLLVLGFAAVELAARGTQDDREFADWSRRARESADALVALFEAAEQHGSSQELGAAFRKWREAFARGMAVVERRASMGWFRRHAWKASQQREALREAGDEMRQQDALVVRRALEASLDSVGDALAALVRRVEVVELRLDLLERAVARPAPERFSLHVGAFRVPRRYKYFVGRQRELKQLTDTLRERGAAAVVPHGLPGVGKTLLVGEWVSTHAKKYAAVAWLRAESDETLAADLAAFGAALGMQFAEDASERQRARETKERLERETTKNTRVLLVFDNVERPDAVSEWLPAVEHCDAVYTTRASGGWPRDQLLEVGPLEEDAAMELLEKLGCDVRREPEAARALCEELGRLPVALAQAAGLARAAGLAATLRRLRDTAEGVLDVQLDAVYDHKKSIWAVLELSLDAISADERRVLELLAVLDPERVPVEMVTRGDARADLEQAVLRLEAGGQVSFAEAGFVSTHRLIQLHVRRGLGAERLGEVLREAARLWSVHTAAFDPQSKATWAAVGESAAHGEHLVRVEGWREGDVVDADEDGDGRATVLRRLGDYYGNCVFEFAAATAAFEREVELQRAVLGDEHPDVATTLGNLASLYKAQGEYGKALPLYEESLRISKAALGDEHPSVAATLNGLARLFWAQGEYGKALPLFEEALRIRKAALGDEHPDVAATLNNLAGLYQTQGEYGKALPLYEEALRISKAALGDEHPEVAATLHNLAGLYEAQGEYGKALPLYEEALRISKAALGDEHPSVATTLNNLAGLYHKQGEYGKALPLYEEDLRIGKAALGDEHPSVATTLNNLAGLYYAQDENGKALPLLEEALRIYKAALGDEHPSVAASLDNLAELYKAEGEYGKALPLLEDALRIKKAALGDEHPEVAATLNNLAGLYKAQGEYGKALPLYEEALRIRKAALGDEHPYVAATLNNLAGLYRAQGEYGKALPLLEEALRIYKAALGDEHPDVAMTLNNLAGLYYAQGEYGQALPLYEEALRVYKAALGDEHPHTIDLTRSVEAVLARLP